MRAESRCTTPARASGSRRSARFPSRRPSRSATMAKGSSPLGAETISPLNAPPLRMGLLTKLNLLVIGLIVATALGVAAFLINQQLRDEGRRVRTQVISVGL